MYALVSQQIIILTESHDCKVQRKRKNEITENQGL